MTVTLEARTVSMDAERDIATEGLNHTGLIALVARTMVNGLVDEPAKVKIEAISRNGVVSITIFAAEGEAGKLIGKAGRTARSMRTILQGVSRKYGVHCDISIVDPIGMAGKGTA